MIGLSPLSPGHRRRFQPTCVRPSTGSYPRFSLPRDSSPGFAPTARDLPPCSDSLSLRLASKLNLAPHRWLAGSFYKRHAVTAYAAPTARGRTVSGAVSLPSRGAFHLSLTVLVRYRSQGSVQGWMVVHPASDRVPRARPYSGTVTGLRSRLRVRGCNPLRPALPCRSARLAGRPRGPAGPRCTAPQPRWREGCRPYALTGLPSAPFRSPLLGGSRD